jgi:hypothetical protein
MYHKYKILEISELRILSCNERNFLDPLLHLTVFLSQELSSAVYVFIFLWRTEIVQPVSAAHTYHPVTFLRCLQVVFPELTTYVLKMFGFLLIMNTSFIYLLFCILRICRPVILKLFTLSFPFLSCCYLFLLYFFHLSSVLLTPSVWKKKVVFFF